MADAFSNYAESGILQFWLRADTVSKPTIIAVGLTSIVPTDTATNELTFANGYGRVNLGAPSDATWDAIDYGPGGSGHTQNTSDITFGPFTADIGMVSGVIICDNYGVGSGNVIWRGQLATARDVRNGDSLTFSAGALDIYIS